MLKKTPANAIRGLVVVLGVSLPLAGAMADVGSPMTVTAQVNNACTIDGTGTVDFGTIDPAIDNDTSNGIDFTCTTGFTPQMTIDGGGQGNINNRAMDSGGNLLSYQLYSDVAGGTVWGDTPATGKQVVGTGVSATTTVYGRVAQADAAVALGGTYNDTVTVTIVF